MEIAYHLHMPLYKLQQEMPYDELAMWFAYFDRRPIGWREDLRTAYMLNSNGDKRKPDAIFPSLQAVSRTNRTPIESLKSSFLFHKMLSAVGGDKLDLS